MWREKVLFTAATLGVASLGSPWLCERARQHSLKSDQPEEQARELEVYGVWCVVREGVGVGVGVGVGDGDGVLNWDEKVRVRERVRKRRKRLAQDFSG